MTIKSFHRKSHIWQYPDVLAAALVTAGEVNQAMRIMRCLLLAGMILLFCCTVGNAQTLIYSNSFSGGAVAMNRQTPTYATNYAGGARAVWWTPTAQSTTAFLHEDGTIGTNSTTVLLPFTPRSGYVYTLEASVTVPVMTAGKWINFGYAQFTPPLNTCADPRFGSMEVNGNPWGYLTEGSGACFFFPTQATSTANSNLMTVPGTYTVQMKLDTTAAAWKASEFVNGTQIGTTFTYSGNPLITAIGVGQTILTSSTGIKWNYLTLSATGSGTVNAVSGTVTFSSTGKALNSAFVGLSYEKLAMTATNRFNTNNTDLVGVFSLLSPAILRIGGGTVDTTGWNGISNTIPITTDEVDNLAAFMNSLPAGWQVIYGINYFQNTPANVEAEGVYVASKLGSRLYGFEIGNEPEFYPGFTYSAFLTRWRLEAAALTNHVPGWAITNGGNGWVLVGADAGQGQLAAITDPFASDLSGRLSQLTQHYYVASAGSSADTMQKILQQPDTTLRNLVTNIVGAATGREAFGARITESGSYAGGGIVGISDAYGSGLWTIDAMFLGAGNGLQGFNFHGGGVSPYSPILDPSGSSVSLVEPGFYAMELFSMIPQGGSVVPTTVAGGAASVNFGAYGVKYSSGAICAVLNNKEADKTISATLNLGSNVASAALVQMTAPQLFSTNDFTLGGAPINTDGSWDGGIQSIIYTPAGQLTLTVPPISTDLLIPITAGSKPAAVSAGPFWSMRITLTTGLADIVSHFGDSNDTHFVMGDWDGNGSMTPGVVRTNSSGQWEWLLVNSDNGSTSYDFAFGDVEQGDVLLVGDWDGNGKWSPGIARTNGMAGAMVWLLTNTNMVSGNATTNYNFQYGDAGDFPVVGDWNGDGTFTPGAVKAGSNTWALRNSNSGGAADLTFAYGNGTTDVPIVGDWDGNGTWTCGAIRNGNNWLLRNSNTGGGADLNFGYGSPGDTFLVWK